MYEFELRVMRLFAILIRTEIQVEKMRYFRNDYWNNFMIFLRLKEM